MSLEPETEVKQGGLNVNLHRSLCSPIRTQDGDQTFDPPPSPRTPRPPDPSEPQGTRNLNPGVMTLRPYLQPFERWMPSSQKVKQFVPLEWSSYHPLVS